jgi:hypothetical protein
MENRNAARKRLMQRVVLAIRGLPPIVAIWKAAEKNMGAIPTAGNGLAETIPHGRSRANAGTKAHIATRRSRRCGSIAFGDGFG